MSKVIPIHKGWQVMLTQNMIGGVRTIYRDQTPMDDPESVACELSVRTGIPTKVVAWK